MVGVFNVRVCIYVSSTSEGGSESSKAGSSHESVADVAGHSGGCRWTLKRVDTPEGKQWIQVFDKGVDSEDDY